MNEFEITDFELGRKKTVVKAQGIAEAIFEYLPWPSLDITIDWLLSNRIYTVIDNKTNFKYTVIAIATNKA